MLSIGNGGGSSRHSQGSGNELATSKNASSLSALDRQSPDEKKFKEEIVLIGEKSDIESLLDNENNQLYNLIMANSMRAGKLSEIEADLEKKRYEKVRKSITDVGGELVRQSASSCSEDDDDDDDYEIEIEINESVKEPVIVPYEVELRRLAKYLVDEITKISLNKVN